jgi:hypothetical protein
MAKTKGIKRIRTVNIPNSEYAHVYVTREQGKRQAATANVKPKKVRGKRSAH